MASQIEHLDNSMVKVTIEVPQDDFKSALEQAFRKNAKRFTIPGFRKGKAPMKLVTNYYGEGILYDDAIDIAIQPAYDKALAELDIEPFSQPDMQIEEIGSDKGMTFNCIFAIRPEVKLGDYKGVVAYKPDATVDEDLIDKEIERAREQVSRLVPVTDRAVEDGDTVIIDYSGSKDGELFEGGQAENHELVIGSKSFIPGFEEKLIGHEIGDEFDIDLTFPEEYHSEDLAGQDVVFAIKLHEIKVRELPELDDDFVKDVTEDCDTVEEYRDSIRKRLTESSEKHANEAFKGNAINEVVKNAEIDIPHVVIHEEMNRMYEDQARQMQMQGFSMEQYLQMLGLEKQSVMAQLHGPAEQKVKTGLVLDAIYETENLEITDEARDEQIQKIADMYGMQFEDLKKNFDSDVGREMLDSDLKKEIAMNFITEHAEATDVEPEPEIDEHVHEHGPDCGCGHDHGHDHESDVEVDSDDETDNAENTDNEEDTK
ncbi:MAG TPA: trigger factor [Clostridiaceae bacterium]|nr:trigger factor [Clostridiaceae bacterium]